MTFLFSWAVRGFGLQPRAFDLGIRPVSTLVDAPNFFSVVVAVLAGIVGIVSLTQAGTGALLGVFRFRGQPDPRRPVSARPPE